MTHGLPRLDQRHLLTNDLNEVGAPRFRELTDSAIATRPNRILVSMGWTDTAWTMISARSAETLGMV